MAGSRRMWFSRACFAPVWAKMTSCVTRSAVVATGVTATWTGSRRYWSARPAMFFGMVAEKNRLWRSFGSIFTMRLRAWMKPRSSIWSALVEDEDLDGFEGQRATLDEIHEAARRGDEDVDAVGQRLLLAGDGDAAEHHGVGERKMPAVIREALGDLVGELAGGREHQHATAAADGLSAGSGRGGAGSAMRRRPSCRCRSGRCRRGRDLPWRGGGPGPGSGSASCSRPPPAPAARAGRGRNR